MTQSCRVFKKKSCRTSHFKKSDFKLWLTRANEEKKKPSLLGGDQGKVLSTLFAVGIFTVGVNNLEVYKSTKVIIPSEVLTLGNLHVHVCSDSNWELVKAGEEWRLFECITVDAVLSCHWQRCSTVLQRKLIHRCCPSNVHVMWHVITFLSKAKSVNSCHSRTNRSANF